MATDDRTWIMVLVVLSSLVGLTTQQPLNVTIPEEMFLSTSEIIRFWGYPAEQHQVRTDDGYYLGLHRIPHGKGKNQKGNAEGCDDSKPVMLLVPGLLLDSTIFVVNLPHQSLGFMLADAGYDVWIGDTRGTTHSVKHQFRSTNSSEFWNFSWDDMAKYDLPAMVNYVLKITQQSQLYYVGFSQGNLIGFAGLSEHTQLQSKIKKFFALAPVTKIGGTPSLLMKLQVLVAPYIKSVLNKLGIYQWLPHNQLIEFLAEVVCPQNLDFCKLFLLEGGGREENFNVTRLPLYLMHIPAGTSIKNMEHFAQAVTSNKFRKFDYGCIGNLVYYGSFEPPSYDLKKLSVPTVLFSGTEDTTATPKNVEWAASQLPHVEHIVIEGYGHNDFVAGIDAWEKLYAKLIEMAH